MPVQVVQAEGTVGTYQPAVVQTPGFQQRGSCCGRVVEHLYARTILVLGAIHLVIGILCVVFNIASIVMQSTVSYVGHGIWCGLFIILAGAFAAAAGKKKQSGLIVTCMVLCIIVAVLAIPLISLAAIGWALEESHHYYNTYSHCCDPSYDVSCCNAGDYQDDFSNLHARNAMHGLLVTLAVVEACLAIVTSCLCCHAICCCRTQGRVLNPAVRYIQAGQGMQVILIQGQDGSQQAIPVNPQAPVYSHPPTVANPHMAALPQGAVYQGGPQQPPMYNAPQLPSAPTGDQAPPPPYQPQAARDYSEKL